MEQVGTGMRVAGTRKLVLALLCGAFGLGGLAVFGMMARDLSPDSPEGILALLSVLWLGLLFLSLGWSLGRLQGGFHASPRGLTLYGTSPGNGLAFAVPTNARLDLLAQPEDQESGFSHLHLRLPQGLAVRLASSRDRRLLESLRGALDTLWGLGREVPPPAPPTPILPQPAAISFYSTALARPLCWLMLFGGLLSLSLGTLLFLSVASAEVFGFLVGPFLGLLGLLFLGSLLGPTLVKTTILRQGQTLVFRRSLGPFLLGRRVLPVEQVEELLIEPRGPRGFRLSATGSTLATIDLVASAGRFGRPAATALPALAENLLVLARGLPAGGDN
jgi:hypothetical protein